MLENSIYSVISPEGCASILWKDAKMAPKAAEILNLTAQDLLKLGIIDSVIPEPIGGAHRHANETMENVRQALMKYLNQMEKLSPDELRIQRQNKFLTMTRLNEV